MASATTTKKGSGGGGRGKAKIKRIEKPARVITSTLQPLDLDLALIERCPFQPRQAFPAEEIKALAESIATHGQIHPIAVRLIQNTRLTDTYELVDGERRFRAVKSLGWKTIRAECGDYSDVQVRAIVLATALQRKELNAIEEARAFQTAIDAGDAAGPTELAKQLGLSQGHVSNRLRLLELPENVRAKIISREISPTNARALVPYKAAPAVLDMVAKYAKGEIVGAADFLDAIDDAVHDTCRRINTDKEYDYVTKCNIPQLKLTDEQRESLGIITHTRPWNGSKPCEYATNAALYDEIFKAHKKAAIERAKKKKGKAEGGEGKGAKAAKKPLTPAEKKRADEEEKRKDKERAEKLARGVWRVAIDWRRRLIAAMLRGEKTSVPGKVSTIGVSVEDTLRLLLYFASSRDWRRYDCECSANPQLRNATERYDKRELLLWNGLVDAGVPTGGCKKGRPNLVPGLIACGDQDVIERSNEFLASMIWNEEFGPQEIPDETILEIADYLTIEMPGSWEKEALGEPWTEHWLELRTKEQLAELAKSWKVEAGGSKADMVARLMRAAHRQKPPAELLKPKKPK